MNTVKHIGVFGRRNAGKSSIVNLLLGQDFAIVSQQAGTTTDPVKKRMEIPGIGPVQLIDTAGVDDSGEVGQKRIAKTLKLVEEVDLAVLVFTGNVFGKEEKDLLRQFKELDIPVVIVHNQTDIIPLDYGVAGDLTNMYGGSSGAEGCGGDAVCIYRERVIAVGRRKEHHAWIGWGKREYCSGLPDRL